MKSDRDAMLQTLIPHRNIATAQASRFAPVNIALIKYWGKRDTNLNLPVTSSLSISLADKGCQTQLSVHEHGQDHVYLNGELLPETTAFSQRIRVFLDMVRPNDTYFKIETTSNVPVASGLASSACGYAALSLCLNDLFAWQLPSDKLSILARLGSGSASRSLWHGFVEWQAGSQADGLDSFAKPLSPVWPDLRVGILLHETGPKKVSSRDGMIHTQKTSPLYPHWPEVVAGDLQQLKQALQENDFATVAKVAEGNAMAMHALMLSARPSVIYSNAKTLTAMQQVQQARADGLGVYMTQDAGPHLKLLFTRQDESDLKILFPEMEVIAPFSDDVPSI